MSECQHVWGFNGRRCLKCGEAVHDLLFKTRQQLTTAAEKNAVLQAALEMGQKNCDAIYDDLHQQLTTAAENEARLNTEIDHSNFLMAELMLKISEYEHKPMSEVKAWCDVQKGAIGELVEAVGEIESEMTNENNVNIPDREKSRLGRAINGAIEAYAKVVGR